MDQWNEEILNNKDDQVTIVYFSSKYCRTCKVFTRKLQVAIEKLNNKDSATTTRTDRLRVATAEITENRDSRLFQTLGINIMPTIQFYYKGTLLTNLEGILPKNFDQVEKAIEYYLQRTSTF